MLKLSNVFKTLSFPKNCCGYVSISNHRTKVHVTSTGHNKKAIPKSSAMGSRQWEFTDVQRSSREASVECIVMSYNVLAQDLIEKHPYLYTKHEPHYLRWDQRFRLLMKNIADVRPHILCLQEVQTSHLPQYVAGLQKLNLTKHIFKKRTFDECLDGCAIFFNSSVLHLKEAHPIEYFRPDVQVLNRPNVAIIAKFRSLANPNIEFVVATTHLLFNPRREDVRLAQVQLLLAEIDRIAKVRHPKDSTSYVPVILTGDFNLQPSSASYRLLTQGTLQYEHLSANTLEERSVTLAATMTNGKKILPLSMRITDNCQHFANKLDNDSTILMPFQTGTLQHKLNFCSAYDHMWTATSFQKAYVTVDYIFYSRAYEGNATVDDSIKLLATYTLTNVAYWQYVLGPIPNMTYGSDHFSLAAKFLFAPKVK